MEPQCNLHSPRQRQQPYSFVLHAPVHEATFFSLTLVEELLRQARTVDQEFGFLSLPLPQSRESTRVLSRIVQESRYEEYWPTEYAELEDTPPSAPSAAYLLRTGILRALGFRAPGLDAATDDGALALGREIVANTSLAGDPAPAPLRYWEAAQEELRHVALGEWCEDLIFFAVYRGFSAEQVRCVLLTAMHLMNIVACLPHDATDAEAESRCARVLEELLIEQACGLPKKVIETHESSRMVTVEVRDPRFVSAIEAKLAQEKNKKQQRVLQEQLANAPTVSETRREVYEERFLTEIVIGPYFTLQEVAQILNFFSSSIIRHWRLFHTFLAEPQPIETHTETQVHWDVFDFCVPPLDEFLEEEVYKMDQERQSFIKECEKTLNDLFDEEFMRPLSELQMEKDAFLQFLRDQEKQAEEDNIKNALDAPTLLRVARAFALRLDKCIERNEAVGKMKEIQKPPDTATTTSAAMPLPSASLPNTKKKSSQVPKASTRLGRAASGARDSVSLRPVTPTVAVIPADAVFSLEDVEKRVKRLENAVETMVGPTREKGKKKR